MFPLQQPRQGSPCLQKLNGLATKVKQIVNSQFLRIPCWLISIQQVGSESKLTPLRSRTSSVSPSRAQSSSPSRRPARRTSSSESPFTGGATVRGKAGDGGNPLDKYVPFDQFRASRGQDSVNYSAKASSSSYTAAATSYSSSALRYGNNYATK